MAHPGLRRVFERTGGAPSFVIDLEDERIEALDVEIGWAHRGFELEAGTRVWAEGVAYARRLGLGAGLAHGIAYALAVESIADRAPARPAAAVALWRTLTLELTRIQDHFVCLAVVSAAVALPAAEARAAGAAEAVARFLFEAGLDDAPEEGSWIRPGSERTPTQKRFAAGWAGLRGEIIAALRDLDRVLLAHPALSERLRGVGVVTAAQGLAFGVTGPALRAAGVAADVRVDRPYLAYAELDFRVPVGEHGDALDRVLVRAAELRESLSLVDQCLTRLEAQASDAERAPHASGPAPTSVAGAAPPSIWPSGTGAAAVEAATGELAFVVASEGGPGPTRVRCRAPSFLHAQVLPAVAAGMPLDDLVPTLASLHVVAAECDR